jgi:hypothetical protein
MPYAVCCSSSVKSQVTVAVPQLKTEQKELYAQYKIIRQVLEGQVLEG